MMSAHASVEPFERLMDMARAHPESPSPEGRPPVPEGLATLDILDGLDKRDNIGYLWPRK
jgi:hypothetical protein